MNPNSHPKPAGDVQVEELEEELLLYHPGQGKAYNLNGTAAFIWSVSDGTRSVEDIAQLIHEQAPETAFEQIVDDVKETIQELADDELFQINEPET